MDAQTISRVQAAPTTRSATITPGVPVRLFLLSDHRLLREGLARFLTGQPDIVLVASKESSVNLTAEIVKSTCDVLLVDPANANTADIECFDRLQRSLSKLRIVMLDVDASVADVTSIVLSDPRACQDSCQAER